MGETQTIGVPTMSRMSSAFGDYAIGALGGLIYLMSQSLLGTGLLGSLAAPVLAGSAVKGPRGTALATVAGFLAVENLLGGGLFGAAPTSTGSRGVM